jgi:AraC-like DNA-binding protein
MPIRFASKILFENQLVRVRRIEWEARDSRPAGESVSEWPEITLMTRGMFVKHGSDHRGTADPSTLVLINQGETYHLAHPVACRCACTALLVNREILADIMASHHVHIRDSRRSFPFSECPADPGLLRRHHVMLSLLDAGARSDVLAVEETALELARRAVGIGFRFHGRRRLPARSSTTHAYDQMTQAVRELLASRYTDPLTLADIAAEVHCTPNYVCDVFKRRTGLSVHQYLTRLRLAAALQELPERRRSLASLAVDLGFSHHSHFTAAFRRAFGLPPSKITTSAQVGAALKSV